MCVQDFMPTAQAVTDCSKLQAPCMYIVIPLHCNVYSHIKVKFSEGTLVDENQEKEKCEPKERERKT